MLQLPKNVWILAICLALFMSLSVFMLFVGGIVGNTLATSKSLSTLPVATIVVGTALSIIPVIRLMSIFGRKKVFLSACLYTIVLIGLSIYSILSESFVLFCFSSFCLGATVATMNQFSNASVGQTGVFILEGPVSTWHNSFYFPGGSAPNIDAAEFPAVIPWVVSANNEYNNPTVVYCGNPVKNLRAVSA